MGADTAPITPGDAQQGQGGGAAATLTGMGWMAASNVLARVVGLAGQIITGWLLLPEDLGVYAFAVSLLTAIAALRSGGVAQVMINRGREYAAKSSLFLTYSLAINLLAAAILLGMSAFYFARHSAVAPILLAMAISIPVGTPGAFFNAKLTIDRRFRELAAIGLGSTLLWQLGVAGLALLGFGSASFAAPAIIQALFETLAGRYYVQVTPPLRLRGLLGEYRELLRQTRWVMLSAASLALATTGDYLAVGILTDPRTLGLYFFAFQLVVAFGVPINNAIESVLPAILANLDGDRTRQINAFSRVLHSIAVVAVPVSCAFGLALHSAIHLVWAGKWDAAAPIAVILAACLPAWLIVGVARALIEARGLWRGRFLILLLYGVGGMGSAALGTRIGGIHAIAVCVATFYLAFCAMLLLWMTKLGVRLRPLFGDVIVPVILDLACLAASIYLTDLWLTGKSPLLRDGLRLGCFLALAAGGNWLVFKATWLELAALVAVRWRRSQTARAAVTGS